MKTPRRAVPTVSILALACALAACAGPPLVELNSPGLSRAASQTAQDVSLASAKQELLQLRASYREAMGAQLGATQNSGAGLIALGALVTGLAAGKAHSDAIVGTSLIGGTAYAIGTLTLDRRRVLAFDAGIKALDCAQAAVIPLDLGTARQQQLQGAGTALQAVRRSAKGAADQVRAALQSDAQAPFLAPADAARARELLTAFEAALTEAAKTQKAATQLGQDTREIGLRLQATVQSISQRVDAFIAQTVPDLSAVPQAIAGLGGFAAAFAPGAGVDKTLAAALASSVPQAHSAFKPLPGQADSPTAQATRVAQFKDLLAALGRQAQALEEAVAAVNEVLGSVDAAAVNSALKSCNVADVIAPLALEPDSLSLVSRSGASKGFAIKAGKPPYSVRWLDAAPEGLVLSFAGGLSADTAQVQASASTAIAAGSYRLRVNDSSGQSAQLSVNVSAGAGAGAPAAGAGVGAGAADARLANDAASPLDDLARTLNQMPAFKLHGVQLSVVKDSARVSEEAGGKRLSFAVRCGDKPARKLDPGSVVDQVLANAKVDATTFKGQVSVQSNRLCLSGA